MILPMMGCWKYSNPAMLRTTLPALAHCHRAAFTRSLATALGQRYVARMLSWYLSSDKTFIFHIEDEQGCCAGYCGGTISDGSLGTGKGRVDRF